MPPLVMKSEGYNGRRAMMVVEIPDFGRLELEHVVLDFNGTMAVDGDLIDGVRERLEAIERRSLSIHVVTADTFGKVASQMKGAPGEVHVLPAGSQDRAKLDFIEELGSTHTVAIGNGRNDRLMLERSALGIAVIHAEGVAAVTLASADVLAPSITDALDLLLNPLRLVATLRS
jgi:soluble P-type ATPase